MINLVSLVKPHRCEVGPTSQLKWNGGRPVYLCAHGECNVIVVWARWSECTGWVPGERWDAHVRG